MAGMSKDVTNETGSVLQRFSNRVGHDPMVNKLGQSVFEAQCGVPLHFSIRLNIPRDQLSHFIGGGCQGALLESSREY